MQALLASDVVYSQRVAPQIEQALNDARRRWPDPDPEQVADQLRLARHRPGREAIGATVTVKRPGGKPAPGSHGHGLTDVKVNGVTLSTIGQQQRPAQAPRRSSSSTSSNQGENDEVDVQVNVTISGPGVKTIQPAQDRPQTKAGSSAQVSIPLAAAVPTSPALVTVSISKVPGEKNRPTTTPATR